MLFVLKEEAFEILISRFAEEELGLMIGNPFVSERLRNRLARRLLNLIIETKKNEN